jgi:hypothetical protein
MEKTLIRGVSLTEHEFCRKLTPSSYVFAGPTAIVTTAVGQRLTGSAEAPMGLAAASPSQLADIGLCYQPNAGGTLTNFIGAYSTHRMFAEMRAYPAAGTVVPGAGTWNVGLCVRKSGPAAITQNDYVNGWVLVTN